MNLSNDLITGFDDEDLATLLRQPEAGKKIAQLLGAGEVQRILDHAAAIAKETQPASMALAGLEMPPDPSLPLIVLLHGITDSHLANTAEGRSDRVWMSLKDLMLGKFTRQLPLLPDGVSDQPGRVFRTDGYAEKKYDLALQAWGSAGFRKEVFCYDWRRSVTHAADSLHTFLTGLDTSKSGQKVVLVCHSMGGLVAATFANRHAGWEKLVERCIFVGSPLGGSFSVPMAVLGLSPSFRKMKMLSVTESLADFQRMAASFPGLLDMVPNPDLLPAAADFYTQDGWPGKVKPLQKFLDASRKLKDDLWTSPIFKVGTHLVSQGVETVAGMPWSEDGSSRRADVVSLEGDGAVLNKCSLAPGLPAYRITGEHGTLLNGLPVFNGIMEIARGNEPNLPPIKAEDLAPVPPPAEIAGLAIGGLVVAGGLEAPAIDEPTFDRVGVSLASNFASEDAAAAQLKIRTDVGFSLPALKSGAFSWQNTLSMALASEAAYASDSAEVKAKAFKDWGFEGYQDFAAHVAKGFVCWDDNVVILSFRGTEQRIADWMLDLSIAPHDTSDANYGKVHGGFYDGFKSVEASVVGLLNRAGAAKKTLWITGHSLGGALGVVAGAELQPLFPAIRLYTFGQPKVGVQKLADFYGKHLAGHYHRFRNNNDIVAQVPPGYSHFGKLRWFDQNGEVKSEEASVGGLGISLEQEESMQELNLAEFEALKSEIAAVDGPPEAGAFKIPFTDIDIQMQLPRFSVADHSMSKKYLLIVRTHAQREQVGT